jgi:hypothetical protein
MASCTSIDIATEQEKSKKERLNLLLNLVLSFQDALVARSHDVTVTDKMATYLDLAGYMY